MAISLHASPQELAKAKWESSGLDDTHAKTLNLAVLSPVQTKALGPNFEAEVSLKIPYFHPDGKVNPEFFRVRYLTLSGFRSAQEKPHRYMQPSIPGVPVGIYLPPLLPRTWKDILADPSVCIYFTEGELKASSACARALPTIGLGGVYNWMSSKQGIPFHPILEAAVWKGRTVCILFDSDAATNSMVVGAQTRLSRELANRGARPFIASIPAAEDGKKQGLDDFLVAQGLEKLQGVIDDAPPFLEAQALWEFNEEITYILKPGLVVRRRDGFKMSPKQFVDHAYANRHYFEIKDTKDGTKMVRKSLSKHWLEWEQRFELERMTYIPGKPQITCSKCLPGALPHRHDESWNTWRGWGCQPKAGNVDPWKWLLDFIFKGTPPEYREWFERWCAYPLQHPGEKLFSAVGIWGVYQGTGKTLIAYTLRNIYGKNFIEIGDQQLRDKFNSWGENKQLVYGDEVTGSEQRMHASKLKRMITEEEFLVEAKFLPTYVIPDCINYYFTSQHPDAFFLEDSDRRFFIHEVVGGPAEESLYKTYDAWLKTDGPSALFDYFLRLDLGNFNPKGHALGTKAKEAMISDTKSDLAMWASRLKEDTKGVLAQAYGDDIAEHCDLFTAAQLFQAYDPLGDKSRGPRAPTLNALGRTLKASGLRQVHHGQIIWVNGGPQKIYAVRNAEAWLSATVDSVRAHWNHFHGSKKNG
jgi:hypothetical protein